MKDALLVMTGGAGGALSRYLVHLVFVHLNRSTVGATLLVNVFGSFALGFILTFSLTRTSVPPGLVILVAAGFLSSFTTFSTLMWDTFRLSQGGSLPMAALNMGASLAVGLVAVVLGHYTARAV